ncbi:FtsX-like permease family protein [Anaerocolumna sp. AGMB13020]|uniref:FtsX-like permease family protein n=1 Tax=Anaerocolumna sp. AGMB13020 TaxID=3081750 RepID=UPI002F4070A2
MLYKNSLVKIKKSFGRYISLLVMVMVGVGFFAGIQASAPDMSAVADQYYRDYNLMDFKIVSSMGLTEEDVAALKALRKAEAVIPAYSLDVMAQELTTGSQSGNQTTGGQSGNSQATATSGLTVRLHSLESVNKVKLVDGRMPQKDTECITDNKSYKVGDKLVITDDVSDKLKNKEFTVVGTVESVLYLAEEYGSTTNGDGKLSSFLFINSSNFIMDVYTEIYLTAAGTKDAIAYSDAYDEAAEELQEQLVSIKPERETARYNEIYKEADSEIRENEEKLNSEKAKGETKLKDAKTELDDNAKKLEDGKSELKENEQTLKDNKEKQNREFAAARVQIADGWKEIDSALTQSGTNRKGLNTKIAELETALTQLKGQAAQLPEGSPLAEQLNASIKQYTEGYNGMLALRESINTLTAKEKELNEGIETFQTEIQKAEKEIAKGKADIKENEKKLADGYAEYNENLDKFNTEMADAEGKLKDAREELSKLERPKWYIQDRDAAVGYTSLKTDIDVVNSVAAVFPFFFILLGMLMTSNSMTRMIAEERSELGTLTSLGYSDGKIISTYLFYILSATGLGSIVGFYAGCSIIPPLIYSNYQYILPSLILKYDLVSFLQIVGVAFVLMTLVTVVSCNKELKQKPAALLRPVPLAKGKTILLERIAPVWKRLSFTWKVTMRNIFRFKKRALMTIVGVSGCTALLLVGFGLRDSMQGVAQRQYGEILRYGNMMILKDETKSISGELEDLLSKEQVNNPLLIRQTAFQSSKGRVDNADGSKLKSKGKTLDSYVIVPENQEGFNEYFNLKDSKSGVEITLNDSGVVLTEKLAEVLGLGKGDTLSVKDTDNNVYSLTVSAVTENYTSHYIYMSNELYDKIFSEAPAYNTIVSDFMGDKDTLSEHLIDSGLVLNVVYTGDVLEKAIESNNSLDSIILLIVVVASLLAIIVLYNLTSINISERLREIATLKVLGFTDQEANGYIYREAIILTIISACVGLVLGIYLHDFIVGIVERDQMILSREISWVSYGLSWLITMAFSLIMQMVTYFKLRTVEMLESLKSVE